MNTTEISIGLPGNARPSSRVLKPPGGGHSNIFAEPDVEVNPPRPRYNQQNSSNLNAVMNTTDPNEAVVKARHELERTQQADVHNQKSVEAQRNSASSEGSNGIQHDEQQQQSGRTRVPPGGFSSGGFW